MLPELIMLGAEMDGPVKHPPQGKVQSPALSCRAAHETHACGRQVVVVRAPDGHMLSLLEEQEEDVDEGGG
jgi:hypothetical protein